MFFIFESRYGIRVKINIATMNMVIATNKPNWLNASEFKTNKHRKADIVVTLLINTGIAIAFSVAFIEPVLL